MKETVGSTLVSDGNLVIELVVTTTFRSHQQIRLLSLSYPEERASQNPGQGAPRQVRSRGGENIHGLARETTK
eukprot:1334816-Amorphochlora_amoeboformis.AAC.2